MTENEIEILNPRYVDPPVVHLEQVLWCAWCLLEAVRTEAITIYKGEALCEPHLAKRFD